MEPQHDEAPPETLERLRLEVEKLRASRERLVVAADADRRAIERELHDGPQQHLVALAVNLQRAGQLAESDPRAAKALLDEMERDVQQALDETAQLAQRIYPPLLETGGLAVALRSAAVSAGIAVSVEVAGEARYSPDVERTVYLCCVGALARTGAGARATVTVRHEDSAVVFEIAGDDARPAAADDRSRAELDRLVDRVEALGGQLTIQREPGRLMRVSGSLPVPR